MSSKLEKENTALAKRMQNIRSSLREREDDMVRKGTGVVSSFVLGALKANGKLASLPTIPGVPRIVTLSIVANGLGLVAPSGKIRQALDGIGESTLNIAAYEWGAGGDVAGVDEDDVRGVDGRKKKKLRALQSQVSDLEDSLRTQVQTQLAPQDNGGDDWMNQYVDV